MELSREEQAAVSSNYIKAKKFFYAGELQKSLEYFHKCISNDPKHHAAMFELSKLYFMINKFELSAKFAEKASLLNPENDWYVKQAVKSYQKIKDYDKAAAFINRLIQLEPDNKQNYLNLANNYIYAEDYKSALEVYNSTIDKFGFDEGVKMQIKQIYLNTGKYSKALKTIEELIEYDSLNTDYLGMAADIHKGMEEFDKAMQYYKKILQIKPNNGKVHLALADYYSMQGNGDKAFEEIKTAFKSQNLDIDTKISILLKLYKSNDAQANKDADELMEILENVHPDEAKTQSMKADFLLKQKKLAEAKLYYKKALKLDNSNYLLWEQLILINNKLKEFKEMHQNSAKALEYFPQHSSLYYFNALSLYELKKYKKAVEEINLGLNFTYKDVHFIDFYNLMAKVNIGLNDYEEVFYNYEKVLSYDSTNTEALSNYALNLIKQNQDSEKADELIKKAIKHKPGNNYVKYVKSYQLYSNNKYEEALKLIEEVITKEERLEYYNLALLISESTNKQNKIEHYKLIIDKLNN